MSPPSRKQPPPIPPSSVVEVGLEAMALNEKEVLCRVVAALLMVDGVYTKEEATFLEELMERMGLSAEQRANIIAEMGEEPDYVKDVELLRRTGRAGELLQALQSAAMADGVFSRPERAMISRVRRIIQYRLGADRYFLRLERLSHTPLKAVYERLERLGEGGFGEIYKARDLRTGRFCVIKQLKATIEGGLSSQDRAGLEDRFWREVALVSKLQSPHTVRLIDAGFDVNVPYMVLEYLEGETLAARLQRAPLTPQQTKVVFLQILDAVAEAHDCGIVHRDLKPENIMLVGRNRSVVKVLDFGISGIVGAFKDEQHYTITVPDQILGTPPYIAPEQILQIGVARRETDIYALGLILCECITGQPIYKGEGYHVLKKQIAKVPVPIPEVVLNGPFAEIAERACSKHWHQRFGPPIEMIAKINAIESKASRDEFRDLDRELYRLYSPADEMIEAFERSTPGEEAARPVADGAQRKKFFDFLG